MKKLLLTLALFSLVATSRAVTITYINTNDYIGNSRDTINDNFSNMVASVNASATNAVVVTFTSMSSNWYYWVSNSADGAISYWLGCNTNGSAGTTIAAGGVSNYYMGPNNTYSTNITDRQVFGIDIVTGGVSNEHLGPNIIASSNIIAGAILFSDINQNGAATDEVMKWNGAAWTNEAAYEWGGTNPITLAFGAGNTATILRADTLLGRPFRADLTSTPGSITFEASWPTNEIADAFVSIQKGTNTLTLVGATIIDTGRASSTNVSLSATNRAEFLFHKALGESKYYVIQLVP